MTNKLLVIGKEGCVPCTMVKNFLNDQEAKYESVNILEQPEVGGQYDIATVPVVILLDENGVEVKRSIGFKPDELDSILEGL